MDVPPVLDHAIAEGDVEVARHLSTQRICIIGSILEEYEGKGL